MQSQDCINEYLTFLHLRRFLWSHLIEQVLFLGGVNSCDESRLSGVTKLSYLHSPIKAAAAALAVQLGFFTVGSKMAVTRIIGSVCWSWELRRGERRRRGGGVFGASGSREREGSRLWGGGSLIRGRWSGGCYYLRRGGASGFRRNN